MAAGLRLADKNSLHWPPYISLGKNGMRTVSVCFSRNVSMMVWIIYDSFSDIYISVYSHCRTGLNLLVIVGADDCRHDVWAGVWFWVFGVAFALQQIGVHNEESYITGNLHTLMWKHWPNSSLLTALLLQLILQVHQKSRALPVFFKLTIKH